MASKEILLHLKGFFSIGLQILILFVVGLENPSDRLVARLITALTIEDTCKMVILKENDVVKASIKISQKIPQNTIGTILCVFDQGKEYLVEFIDSHGETLEDGLTTVKRDDIELALQ
ncbi:MAG: DUF4926 domain-containing protein [Bacteroidota bacterium]|nr:DUF4926 domain-containing protein [Bacteroidota bacterium]